MRFHLRHDWCQHKEQAARHLTLATTTCVSQLKFLPLSRVLLHIYDVYALCGLLLLIFEGSWELGQQYWFRTQTSSCGKQKKLYIYMIWVHQMVGTSTQTITLK